MYVSVIDGGVFEVLATSGDTHLGGEDFDNRIRDFFLKHFKKKYDLDPTKDAKTMDKLKLEAEKSKRSLSMEMSSRIESKTFWMARTFLKPLLVPVSKS